MSLNNKNVITIDIPNFVHDKYQQLSYNQKQESRINSCVGLSNYILNNMKGSTILCNRENLHIYSAANGTIHIIIGKYSVSTFGSIRLIHFKVGSYISYMNTFEADYILQEIEKYLNDPAI